MTEDRLAEIGGRVSRGFAFMSKECGLEFGEDMRWLIDQLKMTRQALIVSRKEEEKLWGQLVQHRFAIERARDELTPIIDDINRTVDGSRLTEEKSK